METLNSEVKNTYGNRIRVRVCGIYVENNRLLLINHALYGAEQSFWSPPGGGMEFGESAVDALKREFKEETGLEVEVNELLFVNEFVQPPLHAVELFFRIEKINGTLSSGYDPELAEANQIIKEAKFISIEELNSIPDSSFHGLLKNIEAFKDIFSIKGYVALK